MRLILALLLALAVAAAGAPARAEDAPASPAPATSPPPASEPATMIQRAIAGHGKLLQKDYYKVGDVAGIFIEMVVIATPAEPDRGKVYGVRLDATHRNLLGGLAGPDASSYLDYDELNALVTATTFIRDMTPKMAEEEREETFVTYTSRDGTRFGYFQRGRGQTGYAVIGGGYKEFSLDDLKRLDLLLATAADRLKGMGAK